jgi:5-methylcytosine-specific restriction endonuclease McrA
MKREEFSSKTKDQAAQRANGFCEKCRAPMAGRRFEFDHVLPDALGGKATLANCQAICQKCHKEKTASDVRGIRKADRQRRASVGARREKAAIASPPKPDKPKRDQLDMPPRLNLYERIT